MSGLIDRIGLRPAIKPKMGKSSAEERFTLMIVSSRGRTHSLGFSTRTIKVFGWTAFIVALALTVFITSYRVLGRELDDLRYLHEVSESQKDQIRDLQDQYTRLNERVIEAESIESQITDMLRQEGLLPQSFSAFTITSMSRTSHYGISRDGGASVRPSTPAEMGRALYVLSFSAKALDTETESIAERAKELHHASVQVVAKSRATPNIKPVEGRISSDFGWRANPFNNTSKEYHEAVDIAAPMWEPLVATADGIVTFAGYKYGYGWTIVIDHGYDYETLYAHCARLTVSYGTEVSRGDAIAYVGQSGSATGPHLHYEVHVAGKPVDPKGYFSSEIREVDHSVR